MATERIHTGSRVLDAALAGGLPQGASLFVTGEEGAGATEFAITILRTVAGEKTGHKARFVSAGHAPGRWDVDLYANEPAQKALASRSRDVPVGAMVVEEHYEKSGAGGAGPVMVMEKRAKGFAPDHGDWRYTVVGASGQLVKDGVVESCAGCHDDAPMDGLFPIE